MPLNNAVLTAFLNGAVTAGDAEKSLQNVLSHCEAEDTTDVIIRVNLAVFAALQSDFIRAKEYLETLARETSTIENLEYYYLYLVQVNLASALFALNRPNHAIQLLEELSETPMFSADEFLKEHACALLADCRARRHGGGAGWYQTPLSVPNSLNNMVGKEAWNYYGHKYLFGELEFWSES